MSDALVQLVLAVSGLTALWMATGTSARARRWAPVVGLAGQPAWLWFAFDAQAWGLLVLSIAYSAVYARGALVQWKGGTKEGACIHVTGDR